MSQEPPAPRRTAAIPTQAALVAIVLLYLVFTAWSVRERGIFEYLGLDYRAYRASGEIGLTAGLSQVYDLSLQELHQRPLYDTYATGTSPLSMPYMTNQVPYLPVFQVPLLLMPFLPPVSSFLAWTLFNAALLCAALLLVWRSAGGRGASVPLELFLSFPVFTTLFFGQMSGWLMVFVAGHLLAARGGRHLRSGLWLGGLLLKPQTLVLLLPGMLLGRRFRALTGFGLSAVLVLGLSLLVAGPGGMAAFTSTLLEFGHELPLSFPASMMNWRAAGINLDGALPHRAAWTLAFGGMVLTAAGVLSLWAPTRLRGPWSPPVALLGTLAGTCAFTWHSHVHMAVIVAPLLAATLADGRLPRRLFHAWALLPALLFLGAVFTRGPGTAHNLAGASLFLLNLALLAWAMAARYREAPGDSTKPAVTR